MTPHIISDDTPSNQKHLEQLLINLLSANINIETVALHYQI